METPEFEVGNTVTFKPYLQETKVKIVEIHPNRYKDGRVIYLVSDFNKYKSQKVKSWTSGKCIKESKYFEEPT